MDKLQEKKVLIWANDISNLVSGSGIIGGIAVQLYFWAKTFINKDWKVYSFTSGAQYEYDGIKFKHKGYIRFIDIIVDFFRAFYHISKIHPDIVISRGGHRIVKVLSCVCKIFGSKYILFGASDANFEKGNPLSVMNGRINRLLFEDGVRNTSYIVVQNDYQYSTLLKNYAIRGLQLKNIWIPCTGNQSGHCSCATLTDVIWIANMRPLKRAEWIVEAARRLPEYRFLIIGAPVDNAYYDKLCEVSHGIKNLEFLGQRQFDEVNSLVAQSKVLACSSKYEGFPNTFLQAWAVNIPVVSTVDPSDVIKDNGLGLVVDTIDDFISAISDILEDKQTYGKMQDAVKHYFAQNHSAANNYNSLMEYINMQG